MQFVRRYQSLVEKFPHLVNGAMGFVIAGSGDYLCQRYFEFPASFQSQTSNVESDAVVPREAPQFKWNMQRSLDLGVIRAAVVTPFVLFWYPTLVRLCPGGTFFRVLGRVTLDQTIGSPIVIGAVFASNSFLQGNLSASIDTFKNQFWDTWYTGLKYWPFIHAVNFGFVPLKYQPLVAHFASVYWNAVLSYYANKKSAPEQEKRSSALGDN